VVDQNDDPAADVSITSTRASAAGSSFWSTTVPVIEMDAGTIRVSGHMGTVQVASLASRSVNAPS